MLVRMPRPESNITVTQGGFVPTQRTPELTVPHVPHSLNFSRLNSVHEPGFAIYDAEALNIDPAVISESSQELLDPDASLLNPADDSTTSLRHDTFSVDLRRQSAILNDQPATRSFLEQLTTFVQAKMARHPNFAFHGGSHAGLASWEPSVLRADWYKIAGDHEGGKAAINRFVPGKFERSGDKSRVLSIRATLDGDEQLEILPYGAKLTRSIHLSAARLLLSREVGLIAGGNSANEIVPGPSMRTRIPTSHLTLTITNY